MITLGNPLALRAVPLSQPFSLNVPCFLICCSKLRDVGNKKFRFFVIFHDFFKFFQKFRIQVNIRIIGDACKTVVCGPVLSLLDKIFIASPILGFFYCWASSFNSPSSMPSFEKSLKEFLCLRSPKVYFLQYFHSDRFVWWNQLSNDLSVLTGFDSIKSFRNFTILFPMKTNNLPDIRKSFEPSKAFVTKRDLDSLVLSIYQFKITPMTLWWWTSSHTVKETIFWLDFLLAVWASPASHTLEICFSDCSDNMCRWFEYCQWYPRQWWGECILFYTFLVEFFASNALHIHPLLANPFLLKVLKRLGNCLNRSAICSMWYDLFSAHW